MIWAPRSTAICANFVAFSIVFSFSSLQDIWIPASLIKDRLSGLKNFQNANRVGGMVSSKREKDIFFESLQKQLQALRVLLTGNGEDARIVKLKLTFIVVEARIPACR